MFYALKTFFGQHYVPNLLEFLLKKNILKKKIFLELRKCTNFIIFVGNLQ